MKQNRNAAPTPYATYPGPQPDTSKSEFVHLPNYPDDFAFKRTKAAALIFSALVLTGLAVYAVFALRDAGWPEWLAVLFLVPSSFLALWGGFLWRYTDRVVSRTLPPEQRVKGKPSSKPATKPLRINRNGAVEETWLPSREPDRTPLKPWGISGVDLMQFLVEAKERRGLTESAWIGKGVERFVLPSGVPVEFRLFRHLLRCLAENRDERGRPAPLARKDPRRGWQLTADLEEIKRQLDEIEAW